MNQENIQTIYINLDDSGKLTSKEKVAVYAGIVFLSKSEKDKFIAQYQNILNSIKCKYCRKKSETCNKRCPEIKSSNISKNDRRRILNHIKRYMTVACIIKNSSIYDYIMKDKASKGRYLDFALRIFVKKIILNLIKSKIVSPKTPVKLILNIDEQATKNNGYYNLKDGIKEELLHGIYNYNYNVIHKPILNELEVVLM